MEQLNKQQIILLALLVSFVSSIATAISVVSLMRQDQTVPVTQTINHVIEKTIERVSSDSNSSKPSVLTKETIVVKEDEAVAGAIETVSKGIAKIFWSGSYSPERFIGLGVIASSSGKIVAKTDMQYGGTYTVHLSGGNVVPLSLLSYDSERGLSVFQAQQSFNPNDVRVYSAVSFADSDNIKLGQSIVLMTNTEDLNVATGIISSLDKVQNLMRTSVKESDLNSQFLMISLTGDVLGIRGANAFDGGFIPANILKTYATP